MSLIRTDRLPSDARPKEWYELDGDTLISHIGEHGLKIPLRSITEGVGICSGLLGKLAGRASEVSLLIAESDPQTNDTALLTLNVSLRED